MTSAPNLTPARASADRPHESAVDATGQRPTERRDASSFEKRVEEARRAREAPHGSVRPHPNDEAGRPARRRAKDAQADVAVIAPGEAPIEPHAPVALDAVRAQPELALTQTLPVAAPKTLEVTPPTAAATKGVELRPAIVAEDSAEPTPAPIATLLETLPQESVVTDKPAPPAPAVEIAPVASQPSQEPKSAPVRESQAPAPAPPPADTRAADILRQVRLHLVPENRVATIQLEPASLGRIAIRLALRKGQVDAQLRVEHRATLDMLMRHVPELRTALERQGMQSGSFDLQLGFGDRGARHEERSEPRPHTTPHTTPQLLPATPAMRAALARALGSAGGVDTYA
jgi:hypothetical protein